MPSEIRTLLQNRATLSASARVALRALSVAWWVCDKDGTVVESDGPGLDQLDPPRKPGELVSANLWRDWPEYVNGTPFAQVADVLNGGTGGEGEYEVDGQRWYARIVPLIVGGDIGAMCVTMPAPSGEPWTPQ